MTKDWMAREQSRHTTNRSTEQLQIKKGRRRDSRESQPKHLSQASSEKVTVHKKDLGEGLLEKRLGRERRRGETGGRGTLDKEAGTSL